MVNYMAITCLNMNTNDRNTKGTVPSVSQQMKVLNDNEGRKLLK